MTSDPSASATRPVVGQPDRIWLRGHEREVEVGAFGAERGLRQRLRFEVGVDVRERAANDDVDAVLSYDRIAEAIDEALAGGRADLLETLAERVAAGILRDPLAARAHVRVEKLDRAPGALGVEIVRLRGAAPGPPTAAPRPRVLFLGPEAAADPRLPAALERLARGPLLCCVGAPGLPLPEAPVPSHADRIAWLAVDQAAWALAARWPRLHVASTRTEIDWALRGGVPAVWAPSRLVPEDGGGPEGRDARLAAWIAPRLDAWELRVIGAETPPGAGPVAVGSLDDPLA